MGVGEILSNANRGTAVGMDSGCRHRRGSTMAADIEGGSSGSVDGSGREEGNFFFFFLLKKTDLGCHVISNCSDGGNCMKFF